VPAARRREDRTEHTGKCRAIGGARLGVVVAQLSADATECFGKIPAIQPWDRTACFPKNAASAGQE